VNEEDDEDNDEHEEYPEEILPVSCLLPYTSSLFDT